MRAAKLKGAFYVLIGSTDAGKTKFLNYIFPFLKKADPTLVNGFISGLTYSGEKLTDDSFHVWLKDEVNFKDRATTPMNIEDFKAFISGSLFNFNVKYDMR
ncbi:MAG: hypothetical protein AAB301_03575 [Nitrospirota bacterium]|jgi:hypothetical protein